MMVDRGGAERQARGGTARGTDSVPTLIMTVSQETEKGQPLALGNLAGPSRTRGKEGWRWGP